MTKNKTNEVTNEQTHTAFIHTIGQKIILATATAGVLYHELIMYIRQNNVPPKLVSHEMRALGFNKVRISEVNKIAQSSDKVFAQYAAKTIGYHKVIDLARAELNGGENVPTKAALLLEERAVLTHDDVEAAVDSEELPDTSGKPKRVSAASKMKAAAAVIFKHAEGNGATWTTDGWTLTLKRVPLNADEAADAASQRK